MGPLYLARGMGDNKASAQLKKTPADFWTAPMLCHSLARCLQRTVPAAEATATNRLSLLDDVQAAAPLKVATAPLPLTKISQSRTAALSLPASTFEEPRQDEAPCSTVTDRAPYAREQNPLKATLMQIDLPPQLSSLPSEAAAYRAATAAAVAAAAAAKAAEAAAAAAASASETSSRTKPRSSSPSARNVAHAAARAATLAGLRAQAAALQVPPMVRTAASTRAPSPKPSARIGADGSSTPSYMGNKTSIRTLRRGSPAPPPKSEETLESVSIAEIETSRRIESYRARWNEKWSSF